MGRRNPVPVPPTVRSHIPGYPEYVDRSRCDIRPEPLNNEGPYGDGPDIVKQLSLEWTPAGPGEQDKEQEEESKMESSTPRFMTVVILFFRMTNKV